MELVSKELIVNELKRRINLYNKLADICAELNFSHSIEASRLLAYQYENLLDFLDTLEVKEIDLDKEIDNYLLNNADFFMKSNSEKTVKNLAKHFYELGLKTQKGE